MSALEGIGIAILAEPVIPSDIANTWVNANAAVAIVIAVSSSGSGSGSGRSTSTGYSGVA